MVLAFKGGDAHAYALIYREYRPLAESICQRILGNPEDAAEAAQETMLRVFQGLPRFNGRYLLRAWVARIATNICLDIIRKRSRRPDELETPAAEELEVPDRVTARSALEDPGEIVERLQERERVRAMLDALPGHHRDALLMREFDGLSHEQIAATLGMTPPQVKALLHRAKKGFKRAWEIDAGRASAFTWPVLMAPVRWVKRLLAPAKDAVTEVAAPVIQLSSQPAVAQATTAIGDRVTAAAGAILVAGTIGIGATVLPNKAKPIPKPSPAPVESVEPAAVPPIETDPVPTEASSAAPTVTSESPSLAPRSRPSSDRTETPEPSPSPSPGEPQQPAPPSEETPTPTPTPAPAWSFQFKTDVSSTETCDCVAEPRLTETRSSGRPGGSLRFGQGVQGAALDREGDAAWDLSVNYSGTVDGSTGSVSVYFTLNVDGAVYSYSATLKLVSTLGGEDSWTYRFEGTYSLLGGPGGGDPIPRSGSLSSAMRFWRDGTLYRATFDLR